MAITKPSNERFATAAAISVGAPSVARIRNVDLFALREPFARSVLRGARHAWQCGNWWSILACGLIRRRIEIRSPGTRQMRPCLNNARAPRRAPLLGGAFGQRSGA